MSKMVDDQPADLGDLLEIWGPELERDGARLDAMPCSRFPPVEFVRTVEVSRRGILSDVVKKLPALGPEFVTWERYDGFFSNVRVFVPDSEIPVKLNEVFTSSGEEFRSEDEAEERDAEAMIRRLERDYKFGVNDLNWWNMRRYNLQNYNCCTGWRRAQEEIDELKKKVEALTKGWRRTLEELDHGCNLVPSESVVCLMDYVEGVFHEGITEFERIAERY